jgi:hypothetical protein
MNVTMRSRVVISTAVSVVCAVLAYTAAIGASAPTTLNQRNWVLLAAGALFTLFSVGVPAREQARREQRLQSAEESAAAARARLRTTFNDTLAPVVQQIGKVATAPHERCEAMQAQAISKVLSSVISLVDADRARACWFALECHGPRRRLLPVDHVGRSMRPTTVFDEGTREGDSVFAALDRGEGRYVPSVQQSPPSGWDAARSRGYTTFIAVPVETGGRLFGMLTLDSVREEDLTGDEVPGVRLLADLLADALAITPAAVPSATPTDVGSQQLTLTDSNAVEPLIS